MVEIDIEAEIESAVEEAMDNYGPDYDEIRCQIEDDILGQVEDHLDYDNIRHQIEGDILDQVEDHIDWSNAEYNIDLDSIVESHCDNEGYISEDDLADKIVEFTEVGCDVVDGVALNLLERAVKSQSGMTPRDFYLPTWDDWKEMVSQVDALSQIIDTSSVRKTLVGSVVEAYESKTMNTEMLMETIADLRKERYQAIRYLSKPDLLAWAAENGFSVQPAMTVADIHKVIL
tara:strand:- start:180 stop:872 length:693 start_codon:yes stop_codon:yes gene_type:complete